MESGLTQAEGKKNTGIQTCGLDKLILMSPKVLGKRDHNAAADLSPQIRSVTLSADALSPSTHFLMRKRLLSRHMRSPDTLVLMHI